MEKSIKIKRKISAILFLTFFGLTIGCNSQKVPPPQPYGAVPSPQQVNWQQLEYYMFIHFGPNTFTGKEWGNGRESPEVFNPTHLNAEQWAATAKAAGMKGIIITAKHHDGFCLWPSKYSDHTVRESPWKNGEGDVLKLLSEACKKYDLKFGVYLSPWDRNHPKYGTAEYNQVLANMLEEVMTQYGEVFEIWFDGANGEGPNGKKQVYDWDLYHETVYKYNPEVIIFSDVGPGARWIGNENGYAGKTNWSTLKTKGFAPGENGPSRESLNRGDMGGAKWVPGEADVSIRPGWFFDPTTNNDIKSVKELLKIYYASVGRNSNFLLNVPVSRKGLIHPNDSTRLMEFKRILDETFDKNLALNKEGRASHVQGNAGRYSVENLLDEDYETYWATPDSIKKASFTINLGAPTTFNRLVLQEYIPLGQRVKSFKVEIWDGNGFKEVARQTTIGYQRILTLPTLRTSKVRVTILDALASPVLSEFQLYKAPVVVANPVITRNKNGLVTIKTESPEVVITYTTNGAEPTRNSKPFKKPFSLAQGGIVKAKAFTQEGASSATVSVSFGVAPVKWNVVSTDSELEGHEGENAIDANLDTAWRSHPEKGTFPHEIVIDLGETLSLKGFTYTPPQDAKISGTVYRYNFHVSPDGKKWQPVIQKGSFGNIKNNPIKQKVRFGSVKEARYIKFQALSSVNAKDKAATVPEIGVFIK